MKVLIDGVCFQLPKSGLARVWKWVISQLALVEDLKLFMLDRGGVPAIAGVELVDFPSYTMTYTAADSLLIQQFCDKLSIDVFTSTYYTSATRTPQVQMVYDMIPEAIGFDLNARMRKEKKIALSYATAFVCLSQETSDDLLRFYPSIDRSRVAVTRAGVDGAIFKVAALEDVILFRKRQGLSKPYFIYIGPREQDQHDKEQKLFLNAVAINRAADFDIVFVGREAEIDPSWVDRLPSTVKIRRLELSNAELALAYSGALALVYPSLNEDCGMPVVEAMASGCPVLTIHDRRLEDIAGQAALIISGGDTRAMLQALGQVREPRTRHILIDAGISQAAEVQSGDFLKRFHDLLVVAKAANYDRDAMEFHRRWTKLRMIQAQVDIGLD